MAVVQLTTDRVMALIDGPVGWLVFNNPERRNAISVDMWEAIPAAFDRFDAEPDVRAVVLRGAGEKAFVAGLDISQLDERFASKASAAQHGELTVRASERILKSPKPTIAMIYGYCIGAGIQISANCDLRIAADTALFAVTAAKLGIGYPLRSLKRLVDIVGPSRAKEIFFTARQFTAAEAQAMGLVDRAVPQADLEFHVRNYCEAIAANAPLTIKAIKHIIGEFSTMPSGMDQDYCNRLIDACFESEDCGEGRRAFLEKRRPTFCGR
jgi:enoyl-CoA hydratase/carnithine racemase